MLCTSRLPPFLPFPERYLGQTADKCRLIVKLQMVLMMVVVMVVLMMVVWWW